MANKILNQPSGAGLLGNITKKVEGEVSNVANGVKGAANSVAKEVGQVAGVVNKDFGSVTQDVKNVVNAIDQFIAHPGASIKDGLSIPNISPDTLNTVRNILDKVLPHHIEDSAGQKFIQSTQGFRDTLGSVNTLSAKLAGMKPTDPQYGQVKQQLAAAEGQLSSKYGYTAQNAPKPGTLWVDPTLMKDPTGAQLNASVHPTGTPVTTPPNPMDVVFMNGRSFNLTDASGKQVTVSTPEQYKAVVAQNRAAAGIPVQNGDPVAVHLSFEGGGGKGKRYGPAMQEMYRDGVVPGSVTGTSAGAIAAGLVAAGADPAEIDRFMKDPVISKFYDVDVRPDDGGLMDGQVAYDTFNKELQKLTGITDRPVTFADLKIPLQIVATKMSDTNPPAGQTDMTQAKNRTFVFSQETTPNTPVALAMRASMSIPAAFDPVKMVDPTTGREVTLVDGGVLDNLPMGYNHDNLPQIGVALASRGDLLASKHVYQDRPLPGGNLDATHVFWNALNGYTMLKDANGTEDFQKRTQPKPGQFMLSLPTWDLTNPSHGDSTMGFGYDPNVDPAMDKQTQQVTQNFLKQYLGDFGKPGASGTNTPAKLPQNLQFNTPVQAQGKTFQASYPGSGDVVTFTNGSQKYNVTIGQQKLQAMYLDNQAFGDLGSQLADSLNNYLSLALKPGTVVA